MTPLAFFALLCAIVLVPWALLALADEITIRRDLLGEAQPITYDDFCTECAETDARYLEVERWLNDGGNAS